MTQKNHSTQSDSIENTEKVIPIVFDVLGEKEMALLGEHLNYLKLPAMAENYEVAALKANKESWSYVKYLAQLIELETQSRQERAIERKVKSARFPVLKTLQQFRWSWPKKINQLQIQDLFRLQFMKDHSNVILLGGVGLGKTHLATALGHHACLKGKRVLFTNTVDAINSLIIAQRSGRLKLELRKYLKPELLILDELGYLPIDKIGADLLFQIISGRYEVSSTVITSNRAFKDWPEIFNNDSTL
ncbi:MAG: IS21-like element helper ATPase IstB, partial [Methyloprofundus sp.]|nr:IS21-like element helper ATPase IstB [Methyloprofundus sp.]